MPEAERESMFGPCWLRSAQPAFDTPALFHASSNPQGSTGRRDNAQLNTWRLQSVSAAAGQRHFSWMQMRVTSLHLAGLGVATSSSRVSGRCFGHIPGLAEDTA